jgi:hypothetical protein
MTDPEPHSLVLSQFPGHDEARLFSQCRSIYQRMELLCRTQSSRGIYLALPIICMSSIPARVAAADLKDLNPNIGRTRRLIAR